jgi:DNA polymerase
MMERTFKSDLGNDSQIVLPSGRTMTYRKCLLDHEEQLTCIVPRNGKMVRTPFYGAKLFENLIQATAREVMAGVILRLHKAGVRVVMTIHDEVVCEVDMGVDQAEITEIIQQSPEWMPGLPVECGTRESMSYAEE